MIDRTTALERLRAQVAAGRPIIGAGAGTGISAKSEEAGGVDMIIIYNSGRYRMAGRGSLSGLLAYGDANQIVVDMAREVLPIVQNTPVIAGVNGTDPFRVMGHFLDDLKRLGFTGIQNFPTVGLIDGLFRQNLEETGMSYSLEVDMVRLAAERDLLTTPYVFDVESAVAMTEAGADIVVAHMGLTTMGTIGAKTTAVTLEGSVEKVQEIADAATAVNPDVLVICHGGPIAEPSDAAYVLQNTTGVHGFYGASSAERLPTERGIREQIEEFKAITFEKG
ncbi:putative TIM-barrel enzyme [Microbacteriaceae bacterium SG_E_30_P1]|uniref:TIM-barrel enzyme n=1 Tax=Antiquaquibacter oligotrophicus TaxID=2880260 RepID=A0ABT6KQX4_9MICO|nr:phosphoenolpyruvate hydrolase family protein [Antiquaquibacter oligotrophicus]MDH6182216.1 putative TIM-barrel enzyme [Antiquaquibacter oligotrophicus]UDF12124.1 phosphoenolpyruvate hydrolase family protein [Antiquaquibacter oligotrophicus]